MKDGAWVVIRNADVSPANLSSLLAHILSVEVRETTDGGAKKRSHHTHHLQQSDGGKAQAAPVPLHVKFRVWLFVSCPQSTHQHPSPSGYRRLENVSQYWPRCVRVSVGAPRTPSSELMLALHLLDSSGQFSEVCCISRKVFLEALVCQQTLFLCKQHLFSYVNRICWTYCAACAVYMQWRACGNFSKHTTRGALTLRRHLTWGAQSCWRPSV
jgi:hypothetical protein